MQCETGHLIAATGVERFQMWVYHTTHPVEAVFGDNYFLNAHDRVLKGDFIDVVCAYPSRVKTVSVLVSRSDRERVAIVPFKKISNASGGFEAFEAPLSTAIPSAAPAPRPDNPDETRFLELQNTVRDMYRVLNGNGEVVVGDMKGQQYAVDLFGRILEGRISLAGAKAEAAGKEAEGKDAANEEAA